MISDEDFLKQFETGAWPFEHWHHQQHIKVAYLYLRCYPFEKAMTQMREKIRAYNMSHNVPDLPTRGYHETMTKAWMRLVYMTLCEYGPAETADDFYEQNPQLSEQKILRLFYSRDLLISSLAKSEFVEPDLAPLPRSQKDGELCLPPC